MSNPNRPRSGTQTRTRTRVQGASIAQRPTPTTRPASVEKAAPAATRGLPVSTYSAFPPLASVEQHPYIQGQKATEILMELMNKSKEETSQNEAFYKIIIESQLILHDKK